MLLLFGLAVSAKPEKMSSCPISAKYQIVNSSQLHKIPKSRPEIAVSQSVSRYQSTWIPKPNSGAIQYGLFDRKHLRTKKRRNPIDAAIL